MAAIHLTLTPELESLVRERVASGKNSSAEDVVREGLRLLKEREELGQPDFMFSTAEDLENKLAAGVQQLDRGEGIPVDDVFRDLETHSLKRHPNA